jgi:hypothetical protein
MFSIFRLERHLPLRYFGNLRSSPISIGESPSIGEPNRQEPPNQLTSPAELLLLVFEFPWRATQCVVNLQQARAANAYYT